MFDSCSLFPPHSRVVFPRWRGTLRGSRYLPSGTAIAESSGPFLLGIWKNKYLSRLFVSDALQLYAGSPLRPSPQHSGVACRGKNGHTTSRTVL